MTYSFSRAISLCRILLSSRSFPSLSLSALPVQRRVGTRTISIMFHSSAIFSNDPILIKLRDGGEGLRSHDRSNVERESSRSCFTRSISLNPCAIGIGSGNVLKIECRASNGEIINDKEQPNKRAQRGGNPNGVPCLTNLLFARGKLGCRDRVASPVYEMERGLFNESKVAAVSFRLGEYVAREMS